MSDTALFAPRERRDGVPVKSLLIVEDNSDMLEMFVEMLRSDFSIVGTLSTGGAALREASSLNPDIIMLDVSLGDMSGFVVAEHLQKAGCAARIVFVSVHESFSFVNAAQRLGASGYIFKSQICRDLLNALRNASMGGQFVSSKPYE